MRSAIRLFVLAGAMMTAASTISAAKQPTAFPSSAESDPARLGWMKGSPPPADKLITQPQSNFFSFPKMRWTVCHMRELLPTRLVSRGIGAPIPLARDLDPEIDQVVFMPTGSKSAMTWAESLVENYTDGILILHEGRVVYEKFSGCLHESGKHAAMSMTKSLTGLLAEMLIADGVLDDSVLVTSVVPELEGSAFGSATVRQVMDMTTGLAYSEDYSDPQADIWAYSAAASPLPKAPGYKGPDGYLEYLQTVPKEGDHGETFAYKTINTDALGWIIWRASGSNFAELLSQKLWQKLGAEQDAYVTVDAKGTPFAGGGLSAGLRDLGRLGQLMLGDGAFNGEQIFPKEVVQSIRKGGSKSAFSKAGYASLAGGSYRSMWWVFHNSHGAYAARGVHGQTLYIDPTAQMVIARFASHPQAKNAYIDPTSVPAFEAVAEYLLDKKSAKDSEVR